jgi:hypothetical protein
MKTKAAIKDYWMLLTKDEKKDLTVKASTVLRAAAKKRLDQKFADFEVNHKHLCCPISQSLFEDPVIAADGHSYEFVHVDKWYRKESERIGFRSIGRREGPKSPLTGLTLPNYNLIPNINLKQTINAVLQFNGLVRPTK